MVGRVGPFLNMPFLSGWLTASPFVALSMDEFPKACETPLLKRNKTAATTK